MNSSVRSTYISCLRWNKYSSDEPYIVYTIFTYSINKSMKSEYNWIEAIYDLTALASKFNFSRKKIEATDESHLPIYTPV